MNYLEVGHWYRLTPVSDPLELILIDEQDDKVEFQHFDGEIETIHWSECLSIEIREVPAPDDWSAPFDTDRQDTHPEVLFSDYSLN